MLLHLSPRRRGKTLAGLRRASTSVHSSAGFRRAPFAPGGEAVLCASVVRVAEDLVKASSETMMHCRLEPVRSCGHSFGTRKFVIDGYFAHVLARTTVRLNIHIGLISSLPSANSIQ